MDSAETAFCYREDQLCSLPPNVPPCFSQMHKTNFRDAKKGRQSQPNSEKVITDCGTFDANFLTLGPPATSLHSTQTSYDELSEFNFPPFQGSRYDLQEWSGQGRSSPQKPFYSFLPLKEQVDSTETTSNLDNSRGESGEDSVDRNLKMSVGSSDGEQ
ncbi:uncharacterized protein LOC132268130 [Cornus florida]|uniref:uncharacterized protein LOC132268130 n=1 Tax=Cornus florida TaxID=4283 RepID=UPI00289A5719|nr:uncharacterized protein LOC132268130 [Cornus florida]